MQELFQITFSLTIVSIISLVGVVSLAWKKTNLHEVLYVLVALAAGTMMGTAFLHLLPEAAESLDAETLFTIVLASFSGFFAIEKFLHWRHCHEDNCKTHSFGYINILGDSIHNFLDGLIIAAAYMVNFEVGLATTVAVVVHEIPQEIGDFGVLLKAGYTVKKALLLNFLSALTALAGGLVGYYFAQSSENFVVYLTPFAAGSFLYIAATDLLPQLQEEKHPRKTIYSFVIFVLGVLLLYFLQLIIHEPGH